MGRIARRAVALLAFAVPAAAQVAASANFQLDGISSDAVAGGSSSQVFTVYAHGGATSADNVSTAVFQADIGFLISFDPDPGDAPVIYGVVPPHADKAGGETLEIYGRNLGKNLAPSYLIGGNPMPFVNVLTKTKATGPAPAGTAGPADLTVSHVFGTATDIDGFVFSPAIVTPEFAYLESLYPIRIYGTVGKQFQTFASAIPLDPGLNTNFGTLLISPPLFNVLPTLPYFPPLGVSGFTVRLPDDPLLLGFTLYFQNLDIGASSELTNRTQTTFQ